MQFKLLFIIVSAIFLNVTLNAQNADRSDQTDFAAYNNFDFIAAQRIVFYDNFNDDLKKWTLTEFDASDDIEKPSIKIISGIEGKWFKTPRKGQFFPTMVKNLSDEFTIEFDMWADIEKMSEMEGGITTIFVSNKVKREEYNLHFDQNSQIKLDVHPSQEFLSCIASKQNGSDDNLLDRKQINKGWNIGKIHHISISRNKTHIKLYVNEKKYIDLPNGLPDKGTYTMLMNTNLWGDGIYISNFKLAEGISPAMKFDANGKFSTNAIYFNVNSSRVKSESWPALSLAANECKLASGKITIIGHTDSDGDASANQVLSLKRAESVKQILIKNFGVDESKLYAEGKGESLPIDNNSNAEGKANNRRVEFVLTK